jgi:hypothetical protein
MIVRLLFFAEIDVGEQPNAYAAEPEAEAKLDAFREAVLPSENYGITLYRAPDELLALMSGE